MDARTHTDLSDRLLADLIRDAQGYCSAAGIKLSTLSHYAIGNTRWFDDRSAGKPYTVATLDRIRRYMADHPPASKKRAGAA